MNNFSRTIIAASVFFLCSWANATVQVQHLDYSLLLTNDCSSTATTISSASSQTLTQLEQQHSATKALIDDSILIAQLPTVGSSLPVVAFTYPNKSTSKSTIRPSNLAVSYHWQNQRFEWFNAYQSNQSQLTPPPFLALARINQQTWASAAIVINNKHQLPKALEDDFISQRSPLIVFIHSAEALSSSDLPAIEKHNLQIHQTGQLIIATRDITVCDSGTQQGNYQHHLAWIKVDLE